MRILRVIASMAPENGGPCQGIRNSIPALAELGLTNEVVSLDATDAGFLGQDPFPIHALGPSRGPWAHATALMPWLMQNLSSFDIVIIHGLWLYHGYAVRKAVNALKLRSLNSGSKVPKVLVMPHGMLDPYFQRASSRRIKAVRNWIYWKFIEAKVVNTSDGILFTCAEEMQLAQKTFFPYHPKKQLNIGYGVAEPPFYTPAMKTAFAAACPDLGEQPYLLFLSRIHPKKGVDSLIRAYAALSIAWQEKEAGRQATGNSKTPTVHASPSISSTAHRSRLTDHFPIFPCLVIAGPLDSAYAAEMQKLAAELLPLIPSPTAHSSLTSDHSESAPRIYFPGMLSGDAKWGAFHGCEAFVLPSHQENFGIAVVEALACGKPVLISKQVNIWREIVASGAGLAENDTLEGTLRLLEQWLQPPAKTRLLTMNTRECYTKHFSITQAAQALDQAIRSH